MTRKGSSLHPNLDHLEKVFRKYADIQAVYLFGSTASGKTHEESDLDLAILPISPIPENPTRSLQTESAA
jgi:predicted nucleotidyltransferase